MRECDAFGPRVRRVRARSCRPEAAAPRGDGNTPETESRSESPRPCSFAGTKRSSGAPAHRRRIERGVPTRLVDARRIRRDPAIAIDEQAQRDVALHLPRVQRGRISERKLGVQQRRHLVRTRARIAACAARAAAHRPFHSRPTIDGQQRERTCERRMRPNLRPRLTTAATDVSARASPRRRALASSRERLDRRHRVDVERRELLDDGMRRRGEQPELIRRRRAASRPASRLRRFAASRADAPLRARASIVARPRDHRLRQAGQPTDLDAVRPIGAARLQPVQEQDLIADLAHGDVIVAKCY